MLIPTLPDHYHSQIAVPIVGASGRLTSYYGAYKFFLNARSMLEEGYAKVSVPAYAREVSCSSLYKYKGETFKVPRISTWEVVVSKPELIDEVRKAPDNVLSFHAAVDEVRPP